MSYVKLKIIQIMMLGVVVGCARNLKDTEIQVGASFVGDPTTCFSPVEACDERLIQFLNSAKESIDVAIFDLTHPGIARAIVQASKRVRIRVIADKRQSLQPRSLISFLQESGVNVRMGRQKGIMHHKFSIVDRKQIETGSFNYTLGASFKNQENQVYLSDQQMVRRFLAAFEKMWTRSHGE